MKPVVTRAGVPSLRLPGRIVCGLLAGLMLSVVAPAAEKSTETKSDTTKTVIKDPAKPAESTNDWLFLDNGQIKLGFKKSSGVGIGWVSQSKSDRNLVNHFDRGRLIQQSYYGAEDGSKWDQQPWTWNPVQGGDWKGNSSKVLEMKTGTNYVYAKTQARHWASGEELPDVVFEEWIFLNGRAVQGTFKMTYKGQQTHPERDQEIPAVFVAPDLDTLVLYAGDKPWTGGELKRSKPGWPNEAREIPERWAAYVDKNDFGLGVYVPVAKRLTCYRFGDGRADKGACSYFAPLTQFAIKPGKVFEYEFYLVIGSSKEIKEQIYRLRDGRKGPPLPGAPAK